MPAAPACDKPYHWTARQPNLKLVMQNPPPTTCRVPLTGEDGHPVACACHTSEGSIQTDLPCLVDSAADGFLSSIHGRDWPTMDRNPEPRLLFAPILHTPEEFWTSNEDLVWRSPEPNQNVGSWARRKNGRMAVGAGPYGNTGLCSPPGVHAMYASSTSAVVVIHSGLLCMHLAIVLQPEDRRCSGQQQRPGRPASYRIRCECSIWLLRRFRTALMGCRPRVVGVEDRAKSDRPRSYHAANQSQSGQLVLKTPCGARTPAESVDLQAHGAPQGLGWRVLGGKNSTPVRNDPKFRRLSAPVSRQSTPVQSAFGPDSEQHFATTACWKAASPATWPGPRIESVDFAIIGAVRGTLMVHIHSPSTFSNITA